MMVPTSSPRSREDVVNPWRHPAIGRFCRQGTLWLVLLAATLIARPTVHAQDAADTDLEIEIQRGPGLPVERHVLRCTPPSGTVRDPVVACNRIADPAARTTHPPGGGSFPIDSGSGSTIVCTQVYGGPEVAFVRGRFLGAPVDARLTRENGCTMSSYDATMKLLGIP